MVVSLLVAQPGIVAAGIIPHDPWKLAQGRALSNPTHISVVGECENCHTLKSYEGEPNTSYINNAARTLGSYKMALGRALVIGDNLGCTFCHSNQLDNTTMDDILTDFEYTTVQHPVGFHVNGSNNGNEFLSTYGSATNTYQLQCIECHQQSLVGYPYHQGRTTDPGIWSGSWNKSINPSGLTGVTNLASQGEKEHCLGCHADLGAGNGPTKPRMGHLAWGNYNSATNTILDGSGLPLKAAATANCTVCHDTHTSTKANLVQDGLDRGAPDPGRTAVVESNCVAVCHDPGAFSTKGHGGKTGINATNCTPCHTASISHRDTTDGAMARRLGMSYPDTLMSNLAMNRSTDGVDNDMNGVKDDETNFVYSKVSICKTCHMHYAGHGSAGRVSSCLDCHDIHGDTVGTNVAMIRASIFGEATSFTQAERDAGTFFRSGQVNGVCDNDACHTTQTGGLATSHAGGAGALADPCTDCHAISHTANPDTDSAFKTSGGGCTVCHGGGTTGTPPEVLNYWPDGTHAGNPADNPGVNRHPSHMQDLAARVFNETTAQLLTDNSGTALGGTLLSDVKQKRLCAYCHEDPLGANFVGGSMLHNNGTANVAGYLHRLWQTYSVDFASTDAAPVGVYSVAADTCATVDCHNNKTTADGSYGWYDTAAYSCTICHTTGDAPGDDAGTPLDNTTNIADPVSGIHRSSTSPVAGASDPTVSKVAHDDSFASGASCTTCHTQVPAASSASLHINGALTANNTTVGAPEEYYTFTAYTDAALNAGTCGGGVVGAAGCHDGAGDTGTWKRTWTTDSYLNLAGGETVAVSQCGGCHGTHIALWNLTEADATTTDHTNPDTDATNSDLSTGFSSDHSVCKKCHGWGDVAYDKTWASGMHGDGSIQMNGPLGTGAGYNDTGASSGQCSNNCHGAQVLAMKADSAWPVRYGNYGGGDCFACHGGNTAGNPPTVFNYWPDEPGAGAGDDDAGRHLKHIEDLAARVFNETTTQLLTNNTGTALGTTLLSDVKQKRVCAYCHEDPLGGNFNAGAAHHMNGTATVIGYMHRLWQTYSVDFASTDAAPIGVYNIAADTCATVDCHNNKTTLDGSYGWYDSAPYACIICHTTGDAPGDDAGTPLDNTTNIADPVTGIHRSSTSPVAGAADPTVSKVAHDDSFASGGTCTTCHTLVPAASSASLHINGALTANNTTVGAPEEYYTFSAYTDAALNAGTCAGAAVGGVGCHDGVGDAGSWRRTWTTDSYLSAGASAAVSECGGCHGTHAALWNFDATSVDHLDPDTDASGGDSSAGFSSGHGVCKTCHGWDDASYTKTPWGTMHGDGSIQMNGPVGTGTGYNDAGGAAGQCTTSNCHGAKVLSMSSASGWPIRYGDYGAGGCTGCHDGSGTGAAGNIMMGSPHTLVRKRDANGNTTATADCSDCHPGGSVGTVHTGGGASVLIANNNSVGINYSSFAAGFYLGGDFTSGTTEAEICWNCHDADNSNTLTGEEPSEWGTNTSMPSYDYGSLTTKSWFGGTWRSALFAYKDGPLNTRPGSATNGASTHAAGPAGVSGVDAVANVKCSYCHDVHDRNPNTNITPADTFSGKPFLRGSWKGNPYREDGAPRATGEARGAATFVYTGRANFGAVPRATSAATEYGGYQIDQNNGSPAASWTFANSAGLCGLCHGTAINTLNKFGTGTSDWSSGTNSHGAVVVGGTGTPFNLYSEGRRHTTVAPYPTARSTGWMANRTAPWMATGNQVNLTGPYTFRGSSGYRMAPMLTHSRPYGFGGYNWGATINNSTAQTDYHTFSCSKCHTPHASRLPRLLITNCLDTKNNTWDDQAGVTAFPASGYSTENNGVKFSNSTTAVNCHRRRDPAFSKSWSSPTMNFSPQNDGWNSVSPW